MPTSVALLCNNAASVRLFRGPLIAEMARRGCRVSVFAPDYTPADRKFVTSMDAEPVDFRLDRTGANPFREAGVVLQLARLLRSREIDVCLGFMTKLVIYGALAGFLARVPRRFGMVEGLGYFFTDTDRPKHPQITPIPRIQDERQTESQSLSGPSVQSAKSADNSPSSSSPQPAPSAKSADSGSGPASAHPSSHIPHPSSRSADSCLLGPSRPHPQSTSSAESADSSPPGPSPVHPSSLSLHPCSPSASSAKSADVRSFRTRLIRRVIIALYRLALPLNRRLFLLNPDDASDLARAGALGRTRVTVLDSGIGIDTREYAPAPPVTSPLSFLFVGRLLGQKGVREFARAAGLVKARHPETRFTLVGPEDPNPGGVPASEVRAWVDEGLLEWPGAVPDARPWYQAASVFVLPSYREGLPRTTLEALALSRPIITTDAPGCRETVKDAENGFLVPPRDPAALAAAMERFIEEPGLVARMGAASRRLAEQRFDVRRANDTILKEMDL